MLAGAAGISPNPRGGLCQFFPRAFECDREEHSLRQTFLHFVLFYLVLVRRFYCASPSDGVVKRRLKLRRPPLDLEPHFEHGTRSGATSPPSASEQHFCGEGRDFHVVLVLPTSPQYPPYSPSRLQTWPERRLKLPARQLDVFTPQTQSGLSKSLHAWWRLEHVRFLRNNLRSAWVKFANPPILRGCNRVQFPDPPACRASIPANRPSARVRLCPEGR